MTSRPTAKPLRQSSGHASLAIGVVPLRFATPLVIPEVISVTVPVRHAAPRDAVSVKAVWKVDPLRVFR